MNNLDMQIEKARTEMHNLIDIHCDRTAEPVVKKSQELDVLLVKKMREEIDYEKKYRKILF